MRQPTIARHQRDPHRGELRIEGRGRYEISTGIRFFDHMLELFTKHGGFDLKLHADGDLDVDQHHTVEDVGIVLGQLFAKALGDRKGINRAGYFVLPMDETLAVVAVDLGGRPALVYKDLVKVRLVGDLQTELVRISSAASSITPAPTCTPRCSTAAPITTRSKPSSSASRAPCATPARKTRG
jgi:imidazoleglycerol-phosphate dehydratase